VNAGDSYIGDIPSSTLGPLVESGKTPRHHRFFGRAGTGHHQHLRAHTPAQDQGPGHELHRLVLPGDCQVLPRGMLVILESTTYPGTTDEVVLPMLAKTGLEVGSDFFLCFSPERWIPATPSFQTFQVSLK